MTPDQINDIIAEQREGGATYKEIVRHLASIGCPLTFDQVSYRCLKMGIVLDRDRHRFGQHVIGRPFTLDEDQVLTDMRLRGDTLEKIARHLNRRTGSVGRRLLVLARLDELATA